MRTIGVLGGFGPQATMDFELRVHHVAQRLIPPNHNGGYPPMVVYYCRHAPFVLTDQGTPTPTPTAAPRLVVGARLTTVSGKSAIACTIKDGSGKALTSQKVTVQKAADPSGPFVDWMSKKTAANGQATFPYAQPTSTWYVRCASTVGAAARAQTTLYVSATRTIKGLKPRPALGARLEGRHLQRSFSRSTLGVTQAVEDMGEVLKQDKTFL